MGRGAPKVPTYALLYLDLAALLGLRNVTSGNLLDTLASAATVIGGETYDLDDKTVNAGRSRWLTIACAGSAAAKMRLSATARSRARPRRRSGRRRSRWSPPTTAATASYTQNGTEVHWANARAPSRRSPASSATSRRCGPRTARCLRHPADRRHRGRL